MYLSADEKRPSWISFPIALLSRDFDASCDMALSSMGLKRGHLHFILYIGHHPGCSQRQLADALKLDTGHATRYVGYLAREGFIEQRMSPHDARARNLFLTAQGQQARNQVRNLLDAWDERALSVLDQAEQEQLTQLLFKVLNGVYRRE